MGLVLAAIAAAAGRDCGQHCTTRDDSSAQPAIHFAPLPFAHHATATPTPRSRERLRFSASLPSRAGRASRTIQSISRPITMA